ncbi:unnamed protein product [Pleuronectes platessa]|uniref:Uncharacterized protein n=1 Tax=Pleuronectes platessa TaxID=8262 RepID=A0A9N7V3Q9_PLEPL|nr:unnamed protein product [Pleuronectes platessa]
MSPFQAPGVKPELRQLTPHPFCQLRLYLNLTGIEPTGTSKVPSAQETRVEKNRCYGTGGYNSSFLRPVNVVHRKKKEGWRSGEERGERVYPTLQRWGKSPPPHRSWPLPQKASSKPQSAEQDLGMRSSPPLISPPPHSQILLTVQETSSELNSLLPWKMCTKSLDRMQQKKLKSPQ